MSEASPAQRLVIQSLSALVKQARQRVQALGMMNSNVDAESWVRLSQDYAVAQAELFNAQRALDAAIRPKPEHP